MEEAQGSFLGEVLDDEGQIDVALLRQGLGLGLDELARACGLPLGALNTPAGVRSQATQGRLRELAGILADVAGWAGGVPQALAWYRSEAIVAFGGQTAEALVKAGRAGAVKAHLARIAAGGPA